jgi:RHS repeat-associated protein
LEYPVAWSATRESFGKTRVVEGAQTEYLMRFPGQWEDEVGGFSQNWWREYRVQTGSFLQGDILEAGLGWKSIYIYSLGNPILGFDFGGTLSTLEWCKNPKNYQQCVEAGPTQN